MALHWICPPIEVRLEDDGVRVDLNTGNTLAVPVPGGPPGRPGDPGPVGPGVPPGGAAGQYLRKASAAEDDCEWADIPAPPVQSVNGKTGPVELDADDVGALPDSTPLFSGDYDDLTNKPTIPTKVSDLQNDSGFVNAAGAAAAAPVQSVNGQTGDVTVGTYTSGTDGIWTYRKYSDGTYHAWYEGEVNLLAGTAFAGGYFHQSSAALTPPSFSTAVTSLSGSPNGAMLMAYVGHAADYSTYWFNGLAAASNNLSVRLDMNGTW